MPASTIRPATEADAAAIAEVYNESIAAGDSTMDDDLKSEADILRVMRHFDDREGYLVLEDGGVVVGWGIVKRYSDRPGYRFAAETSVYLRRSRRGRGYGTRLQEALLDRCRSLGYHHLVARIFADNAVSVHLHEKFGYTIVGVQHEIGFKHGRWQDVVVMQRVLR